MRREDSFDVACAHYRSAPELFNDEERLHLYALYKQATAGRAPGHNAAVPRMAPMVAAGSLRDSRFRESMTSSTAELSGVADSPACRCFPLL